MVVLSRAHYPTRPGAGYKGVYEHELSVDWCDCVMNELTGMGILAMLAPIGTLESKVFFVNGQGADIAIEIHFNGSSNPKVAGVETLYCPGSKKGKEFAGVIHKHYAPIMDCRDRGIKPGWYKMDKPGVIDYPGDIDGDENKDYFLVETNCPTLILEPDFMSQLDNIYDKQDDACRAIALGVAEYLEYMKL